MKKPPIPQHIYEDLFCINFYISYGVSPEVYKSQVKYQFGASVDDLHFAGGKTNVFEKGDSKIYWIWTRKKDRTILVHELVHVINVALVDRGIKLSLDTDEIQAYLMAYLYKRIK